MKRGKWIAATMALAIGLSVGAFADSHPRDDGSPDGQARYTQRDGRDRAQTWNNGYYDNGRRDNGYYDNGYRDNDDHRGGNWYSQGRDRQGRDHDRDRDRGHDHDRGDRRDRDRR